MRIRGACDDGHGEDARLDGDRAGQVERDRVREREVPLRAVAWVNVAEEAGLELRGAVVLEHVLRGDGLREALVDPVPDGAADEARVGLEGVPVFREVTVAVAHRVRVLAEHERARVGFTCLCRDLSGRRVHVADEIDVRAAVGALVVDRACRVSSMNRRRCRLEVHPVARLVPHRPDDHRGVVGKCLDHPRVPFDVGRLPRGVVAERPVEAVPEAVRLDVGLVDDVEAVLVAEVVPLLHVGIVRRADEVEVVLLHQLDVADHQGARHHLARVWLVLVAVDAANQDRTAVDEQPGVPDLDLAEPDAPRYDARDASAGVLQHD